MSAQTLETLDKRLTAVEARLEQLILEQDKRAKEPRGWKSIVGKFADRPGFEEAVKAGKEWRESEP